MSSLRHAWLLPVLLFLAACAARLPPEAASPAASPAGLPAWALEGRIAVQSGEKAWQANLHWEHAREQDSLRLSGPLDQGLISIVLRKDLIYVNEGQGVEELSRDPEALLARRLGVPVPLHSLRYWILGVPDPDQPATPLRGAAGFQQAGWRILTEQLEPVGAWRLPRKLRAEGRGIRLKILADQWSLGKNT